MKHCSKKRRWTALLMGAVLMAAAIPGGTPYAGDLLTEEEIFTDISAEDFFNEDDLLSEDEFLSGGAQQNEVLENVPETVEAVSEDGPETVEAATEDETLPEEAEGFDDGLIIDEEAPDVPEDILPGGTETAGTTETVVLRDPVIVSDTEAADTAGITDSTDGMFVLSDTAPRLLARPDTYLSGYLGAYGNQLDGFARTVYDERYRYFAAGNTGEVVLSYTGKTTPYTFDSASVSGTRVSVVKNDAYNAMIASVRRDMQLALDALTYDHPELYWTRTGSFTVKTDVVKDDTAENGYMAYLKEISYVPKEVFPRASSLLGAFRESVASVSSSLWGSESDADGDGNVSVLEYIYAAHNYICGRAYYRNEATTKTIASADLHEYTPVGMFLDDFARDGGDAGGIVCEGYARAFKVLLDEAGIGCACIGGTGNNVPHMWNAVYYGGSWYMTDVTWDDSRSSLDFFLVTQDSAHVENGDISRTGYKTFCYPAIAAEPLRYCLSGHTYGDDGMCAVCGDQLIRTDLSAASVQVGAEDEEFCYTGAFLKPDVTVTLDQEILSEYDDYTLQYSNNREAGTAVVTVTGTGRYAGTVSGSFVIEPKPLTSAYVSLPAQTYSGKALTPKATVKDGAYVMKEGTDYSVSFSNNINAGTSAKMTLKGIGNYAGSRTFSFKISQRKLGAATTVTLPESAAYTGEAVEPDVQVSDNGRSLVRDTDYTVSFADNVQPGKASVLIEGTGNYTGEKSASFAVVRDISQGTLTVADQEYTGQALTPEAVFTLDGQLLDDGDYTVSYSGNTESGDAVATATGTGYYAGSVSASFRILPKNLSGSAVLELPDEIAYTGKSIVPDETVTCGGTRLVRDRDYSMTVTNNQNAGTASVAVTGKGNYTGRLTGTFRIIKVFTVQARKASFAYTGKGIKPAVTVKALGRTVKASGYTVRYSANRKIGTATITVTGKNAYKGYTGTATFRITPRKTYITRLKSPAAGRIRVRWKARTNSSGFIIQYARNKKFTSDVHILTVNGNRKTAALIRGLKSGKRYYVRVRAFKTVGGGTYRAAWSGYKSVVVR